MKFMRALLFAALSVITFGAIAGQDIILASAVRAATTTSADIVRTTHHGAHFVLVISAVPGADTVTMKIQGKDALNNYYDLLVGTAVSTTGTTVLKIFPGNAVLANASASDNLPDVYRVVVTHSAGTNFTYSVTQNTMQ